MTPNAIYQESFNLNSEEAFQIVIKWLIEQKAKIKKNESPTTIEATHGSLLKLSEYDKNYKKRIRINIEVVNDNRITLYIESQPIGTVGTNEYKLKNSWFNDLFRFLFSILHNSERKDISISENEELQHEWTPEKKVKNPEDLREKYKNKIIGLSIITIFLFFLTYAPILPFHLILIGSDLIIPGGISFGWLTIDLVIYYIIKYYNIEEE